MIFKTNKSIFLFLFVLILAGCKTDEPVNPPALVDAFRGEVISMTLINSYDIDEVGTIMADIDPLLPTLVVPTNGIDVFRMNYKTINSHGEESFASGAVVIPTGADGPFPMSVYNHGTSIAKQDVPSYESTELNIGVINGSTGYVMVLPDYLGMGDGPGRHPYQMYTPTVTATVDMMRAVKTYSMDNDINLNEQVFLFGYSQGGHAAMAVHQDIEKIYADEFTVTASAPMSGAYDMSGAMVDIMLSDEPYSVPFYLPYILLSLQDLYMPYDGPSDFLKAPWDTTLPPLYDGSVSGGYLNDLLPAVPKEVIRDDVEEAFSTDPDHIIRQLLEENDAFRFIPQAPLRMYYCTEDEQVTHQNTINALAWFEANGATNVSSQDGGALTHNGCVLPSLLNAKAWFDSMKE